MIFCDTTPESDAIFDTIASTEPERVDIVVFRVATAHEILLIFAPFTETMPESVFISLRIVSTVPERVLTVFVREESDPERRPRLLLVVARFEFVRASPPESEAISATFCDTVPENEVTTLTTPPSENVNMFTVFVRSATDPERVFTVFSSAVSAHEPNHPPLATTPERVFTVFMRLASVPERVERFEFIPVTVPERAF